MISDSCRNSRLLNEIELEQCSEGTSSTEGVIRNSHGFMTLCTKIVAVYLTIDEKRIAEGNNGKYRTKVEVDSIGKTVTVIAGLG